MSSPRAGVGVLGFKGLLCQAVGHEATLVGTLHG